MTEVIALEPLPPPYTEVAGSLLFCVVPMALTDSAAANSTMLHQLTYGRYVRPLLRPASIASFTTPPERTLPADKARRSGKYLALRVDRQR